jgi:mRNA interferase RelE/StbE
MYRLIFTSKSVKQLKKIGPPFKYIILQKLEYYASLPDPLTHAKRLKDREVGEYRFRVGDWRILFDVENDSLIIHKIGHRRDIYK